MTTITTTRAWYDTLADLFGKPPYRVEQRTNVHADICDRSGRTVVTCSWSEKAKQRADVICCLLNAELAKPVDTDDDPLHPQYIAGFKAGAYAARRRMELDPKTAPSVEIGKHTCPRCKETFSAFVPTPTPAWLDAPTEPGLWVRNSHEGIGVYSISEPSIKILKGSAARWYGPIPQDAAKAEGRTE